MRKYAGDGSPRRKPRIGMVEKYLNEMLDRENSYVIGDQLTDMQLAANMGFGDIAERKKMESLPIVLTTDS